MPRKVNTELLNKKKDTVNIVASFIEQASKNGNFVPVDNYYETIPEVKDVWNTRAYFIQQFKKFAPRNIEIKSSQRRGTYAKVVVNDEKLVMTINDPVKGTKELIGTVIDKIPKTAKKVSKSKWNKAIQGMEGVANAYRYNKGYVIEHNDGKVIYYA